MKLYTTLIALTLSLNSFAQTVLINTSPREATLLINGVPAPNPRNINVENPALVCIAMQDGFISQGFTTGELKKKNMIFYSVTLEKRQPLQANYKSKTIQVEKITDGTGKIEQPAVVTTYGTANRSPFLNSKGIKLSDAIYSNGLNKELEDYGYKSISKNTMFASSSNAQLLIGAEIKQFSKGTRGSGIQISLLVDWFVYSISEEKVVLEVKGAAGYSDLGLIFEEELTSALSNSLNALMSNSDFQKIANSNRDEQVTKGSVIVLPKFKYTKPVNFSALVKASLPSVVTIKTDLGFGSGFIISSNGYILTNDHVIHNAKKIEVKFSNGFEFDAEEIRSDKDRDVSLIKITGKGFTPLPLNESEDHSEIGTEVIAIGTPHDQNLTQSVTKGIISGKRTMDNLPYFQTDVAVNSGNSGGPLINTATGEVIGIIVSKVKALGVEGISFAIPIEECKKSLNIIFE
jgi:serine protease Do